MTDLRKTKARLLAELQQLRARLAQFEPGSIPVRAAADTYLDTGEHFRAVADYTYDPESWVGPDGRLKWLNSAVERLTGYSVAECMEMTDYVSRKRCA